MPDKKDEKKKERVAIFIDGSNLYHSLKRYKIKRKFQDIITILGKDKEIVNVFYYTALLNKEFDEKRYLDHKNFLEKIKQIPHFNVVLCNLRKRYSRGHLWGRNKGVRSVEDTTVDTARQYVLRHNINQKQLNDF